MISDNWRTFRSCTEKSFLNLRNWTSSLLFAR